MLSVDSIDPPLMATYKSLFDQHPHPLLDTTTVSNHCVIPQNECSLPLIDLSSLTLGPEDTSRCKRDIVFAASEWGFFQVVNHGVPQGLLRRLRQLQARVFSRPFEEKASRRLLDFSDSYRWGTPSATSLEQLCWSEAYHLPVALADKLATDQARDESLEIIEQVSRTMLQLSYCLAAILMEALEDGSPTGGNKAAFITKNCTPETCFLRLNRYPPCLMPSGAFGLSAHTDSDFLTILYQDQVGGLQLLKGQGWLNVKPNPNALIVNIGDLFQAVSNGVYRSIEHRVMVNKTTERFSMAFFLCPTYDTVIESSGLPAMYRKFTFGEFRRQVQEDVKATGQKIGLRHFLAQHQ